MKNAQRILENRRKKVKNLLNRVEKKISSEKKIYQTKNLRNDAYSEANFFLFRRKLKIIKVTAKKLIFGVFFRDLVKKGKKNQLFVCNLHIFEFRRNEKNLPLNMH